MTEHRRTAWSWGLAALGLALLGTLLFVVPGMSATRSNAVYTGSGSVTFDTGTPSDGAEPHSEVAQSEGTAVGGSTQVGQRRISPAAVGMAGQVLPPLLDDGDNSHQPGGDEDHHFGITVESVVGLYPGKRSRLHVVFNNPQPVAISVQTATVTATGPAGCQLDTSLILRTRTFIHRVIVPAHGSKAKSLRFGMRKTATDECQNGVFTLTVTATARRA